MPAVYVISLILILVMAIYVHYIQHREHRKREELYQRWNEDVRQDSIDVRNRLYQSKGHAPVGEPAKQVKSVENGQHDKVIAMPKGVAPLDKAFIDALERERETLR